MADRLIKSVEKVRRCAGLDRELPVLLHLSFAFMLLFSGYDNMSYVSESALHSISVLEPGRVNPHAGYYGLSITYLAYLICTFLAPMVVSRLGAKWSMFVASLAYTAYVATFMLFNTYVYYVMSAVCGIGAALLWTAEGVYVKQITSPGNASRNVGIKVSITIGSLVVGGTLVLIVFRKSGYTDTMPKHAILSIFEVLSAISITANILFFLLPDFTPQNSPGKRAGLLTVLGRSFTLLLDRRLQLLALCFMDIGLQSSFIVSIYPSCLSFGKSLVHVGHEIIAYCAYSYAVGEMSAGFFVSFMSKRISGFGYLPTMCLAVPINLVALVGIFLTFPADANLHPSSAATLLPPKLGLWLLYSFLLGISVSMWSTIRAASINSLFTETLPQAAALSKFFQSSMACASFYYSSSVNLRTELYIQVAMLAVATTAFTTLWTISRPNKSDNLRVLQ